MTPDRLFPSKAEPGEILEDRRGEFRLASVYVDVFDAQQESPAELLCPMGGEQCGIGMPQMQIAIWAWGEAKDRLGCHEFI